MIWLNCVIVDYTSGPMGVFKLGPFERMVLPGIVIDA